MLIHDQHNDFPLIPGEEVVSYKNRSDFFIGKQKLLNRKRIFVHNIPWESISPNNYEKEHSLHQVDKSRSNDTLSRQISIAHFPLESHGEIIVVNFSPRTRIPSWMRSKEKSFFSVTRNMKANLNQHFHLSIYPPFPEFFYKNKKW